MFKCYSCYHLVIEVAETKEWFKTAFITKDCAFRYTILDTALMKGKKYEIIVPKAKEIKNENEKQL